jgi:predicted RNA-binding protein with RPS1 domain
MRMDFNHGTVVDDRIELRVLSPDDDTVAMVIRSTFDTEQSRHKMERDVSKLRSAGFKAVVFRILTTVEPIEKSTKARYA